MKSTTLIAALTRLTTAMAIAAPVVVFGFLYVLQVHPERVAAAESRNQLAVARDQLDGRRRLFVRSQPVVTEVSAIDEFDARTVEGDGADELADALIAVLKSPAVGGVSNVSIETGAPEDGTGATARLFSEPVKQTPVTLTFDARYEQIGRLFWNLRVLPTIFTLESVELTPGAAPGGSLMRAKVSLLVFHTHEELAPRQTSRTQVVDAITVPRWTRDPFAGEVPAVSGPPVAAREVDPVVTSILFTSGRRVAIVDGRIVGAGDQVRSGTIREIEPDAVVIAGPDGRARRVAIARPVGRGAKR